MCRLSFMANTQTHVGANGLAVSGDLSLKVKSIIIYMFKNYQKKKNGIYVSNVLAVMLETYLV